MQQAIDILKDLIDHFEGNKLTAYKDGAGVWTIGRGHTGKEVQRGLIWTEKQSDQMFAIEAGQRLDMALFLSPILKTASPSRQAAIADFIYNAGEQAYKSSTLKNEIDSGRWNGAIVEIKKWIHIHKNGQSIVEPGLVKRRNYEANLLAKE